MIGVCPSCGKPFRMEEGKGGEGWNYCSDVCISPAYQQARGCRQIRLP